MHWSWVWGWGGQQALLFGILFFFNQLFDLIFKNLIDSPNLNLYEIGSIKEKSISK